MGDGFNDGTIGITGGTNATDRMATDATAAADKIWEGGLRVATRGGVGKVDSAVIEQAIRTGNCNKLDIYIPAFSKIDTTPYTQGIINEARYYGANVIEAGDNRGGFWELVSEKSPSKYRMELNTEAAFVKGVDGLQIFDKNNNAQIGRIAKLAQESYEAIPTKIARYIKSSLGEMVSTSYFNCFGILLGALGIALDYQDMLDLQKYLQGLKDKPVEKLTDEERDALIQSGWMTDAGEWTNIGMEDTGFVLAKGTGGNRGNPYHDKNGRFCSAADAVTISG